MRWAWRRARPTRTVTVKLLTTEGVVVREDVVLTLGKDGMWSNLDAVSFAVPPSVVEYLVIEP